MFEELSPFPLTASWWRPAVGSRVKHRNPLPECYQWGPASRWPWQRTLAEELDSMQRYGLCVAEGIKPLSGEDWDAFAAQSLPFFNYLIDNLDTNDVFRSLKIHY